MNTLSMLNYFVIACAVGNLLMICHNISEWRFVIERRRIANEYMKTAKKHLDSTEKHLDKVLGLRDEKLINFGQKQIINRFREQNIDNLRGEVKAFVDDKLSKNSKKN